MILINGIQTEQWNILDRAFQYGDGCFTTLLVKKGKIQNWDLHLYRLKRDTLRIAITDINWHALDKDLTKVIDSIKKDNKAVVKILISRGVGGRGYSPQDCHFPTVVISTHAFPNHYENWQQQGIDIIFLKQKIGLSALAGVKHLNRLEQILLKKELEDTNADDGVVCCLRGKVIETTNSNIFWRKANHLYTPDLSYAGVIGTFREKILAIANELDYSVSVVEAESISLLDADEIFVCNAIMELVSVKKIEDNNLFDFSACNALRTRLTS